MIQIENTGQIQLSQEFGQWISRYAADARFQNYLEIGTWNGRGSTCCFYHGFTKRGDAPTLQSYEINKEKAQEAMELWKSAPQIKIIYGRVLRGEWCPTFDEAKARFPEMIPEWHAADICNFFQSPYVPIQAPEVVLLDGAEYLTVYEFEKVFRDCPEVRVFLLDDTKTAKNPHAYQYLLNNPEWVRVAYSESDSRNGWAVFERVQTEGRPCSPPQHLPDETHGDCDDTQTPYPNESSSQ